MKQQKFKIVLGAALTLAVLGFFTACDQPTNNDTGSTPATFTVTFQANGGSPAPGQQSIAQGGLVTQPPAMTNGSYGFGGWFREAGFTTLWNFATDTVSSNITLYARWDVISHAVNFQANNGSPAPGPQNIAPGGLVTQPPAMNRVGYTFGGWFSDAVFTIPWEFNINTVTTGITLYARWLANFTVDFQANGGSPAPEPQSIAPNGLVTQPSAMTNAALTFGGWFTEAEFVTQWNFAVDTVIEGMTLYARWAEYIVVPGANLAGKIQWLHLNAASGGNYVIEFHGDESVAQTAWLQFSNRENITVTMRGVGGNRIVSLDAANASSMFMVWQGVTLVLDDSLELQGNSASSAALIQLGLLAVVAIDPTGGNLILNGASITGNTGRAVAMADGAIFTMNGGTISGNTGGVLVQGGSFTMNGGTISGNTADSGGGVVVQRGNFTMTGGSITKNTSTATSLLNVNGGGGVALFGGGTLAMSGGTISENNAVSRGGGVFIGLGTFTMTDGSISGNTASNPTTLDLNRGGGVAVFGGTFIMSNNAAITHNTAEIGGGVELLLGGSLTMNGGTIADNNSAWLGGGVSVGEQSSFTMGGGTIARNTTDWDGGGVWVDGSSSVFNKTGGTIYGASAGADSNTADNDQGHAVFVYHWDDNHIRYRNATAGPGLICPMMGAIRKRLS